MAQFYRHIIDIVRNLAVISAASLVLAITRNLRERDRPWLMMGVCLVCCVHLQSSLQQWYNVRRYIAIKGQLHDLKEMQKPNRAQSCKVED